MPLIGAVVGYIAGLFIAFFYVAIQMIFSLTPMPGHVVWGIMLLLVLLGFAAGVVLWVWAEWVSWK